MNVTEKEAATKWCPFVRHFNALHEPCGNSLASVPSRSTPPPEFACVGSRCMAWRWSLSDGFEHRYNEPLKPEGDGWRQGQGALHWLREIPPEERRGFCGLAGKP